MADVPPDEEEECVNAFLYYGLEKVGFSRNQVQILAERLNHQRFVSVFVVCPKTCKSTFSKEIDPFRHKSSMLYRFLTLAWLKSYATYSVLGGNFKVTENTVRKRIWLNAEGIQSLKESKITLNFYIPIPGTFLYSVDCTYCQIEEPCSIPDKKWFSHKLNKPALSYEIAIHLYDNKMASINCPFQAGDHDITISWKEGGLKTKMPPGILVIADKGYIGDNQISTPNEMDTNDVIAFKRRVRARQESFNGMVKEFRVLSECFRSDPGKHKILFEAVSVLVEFSMEKGRPLMENARPLMEM